MERLPAPLRILIALLIVSAGFRFASSKAQAYFNLPLIFWPLPDEYRHVVAYPDSDWTWEYLGLNEDTRCPYYYYRDHDVALESWRDPELPDAEDWLQASRGNRGVACYRNHRGTDIAAPAGTPVYAVADGRVVQVVAGEDDQGDDGMVVVQHHREFREQVFTWEARYMHLSKSLPVRVGDEVIAGQMVGLVGYRGLNTHLHFEINEMLGCIDDCIVNPFGTRGDGTLLWIDYEDNHRFDPATDALPLPSPDSDLVSNGDFDRYLRGWSITEGLLLSYYGDSLGLARRVGEGRAAVEQVIAYHFEEGRAVAVSVDVDNRSERSRYLSISLRDPATWAGAVSCTVVVGPGESRMVTLYGETGEWRNAILAVGVNPSDGAIGLRVSGVSLRVGSRSDDGC